MIEKLALGVSSVALICFAGAGCSAKDASPLPASTTRDSGAGAGAPNSGGNPGAAGGSASFGGSTGTGGGNPGSGGSSSGGTTGKGGTTGSGGSTGTGGSTGSQCDAPGLVWKTGAKTNFTSYPDPGSVECIQYSGCLYEGQFAGCPNTEPKSWVMAHNIVAVFPDFNTLKRHDLCLKSGTNTILVTVLDTCGDSDCSGCCTQNKGSADELIDVESFTDARWGVDDGPIQWADLGPTTGQGCQ
jgi:hypothetical protein